MSCTVQIKTRNPVKSKKINNVIHRTTSETIRLGEADVLINNTSRQVLTAISPPPLKKSSCSFQITGVSLTQRADIGEDSADDLDESHTDDISRVTDNETPSISEDTCSREAEDSYLGSCNALCSITVLPTTSQFGLAIIPIDNCIIDSEEHTNNSKDEIISKASDITNSTLYPMNPKDSSIPPATSPSNSRFPGTRFKIVKVETPEPFRRGRWMCLDYLDNSPYTPKNALTYKSPDSPTPIPQYTMTATTTKAEPVISTLDPGTNIGNPNYSMSLPSADITCVTQSMAPLPQSQFYQTSTNFPMQPQTYSAMPSQADVYAPIPIPMCRRQLSLDPSLVGVKYPVQGTPFIPVPISRPQQPMMHQFITTEQDSAAPSLAYGVLDLQDQSEKLIITNNATTNSALISKNNSIESAPTSNLSSPMVPPMPIPSAGMYMAPPMFADPRIPVQPYAGSPTYDNYGMMRASQAMCDLSYVAPGDVPDTQAASNTSTIIDTKIEKAMDLVKSHLRYTVREEVEVLKERIAILLDRINHLEMENNFLKANATPEVLSALNNRSLENQTQERNLSTPGGDGGTSPN